MKGKALKAVLLVSLLFNLSIISAAGYFYYRDHLCAAADRAGKREQAFAKRLSLTPEQRERIREEDRRFQSASAKARADILEKRKRLTAVLKEDAPDAAAIDALLSEIAALQGQVEAEAIGHILNEKAVLNAEQKAEFGRLLDERLERAEARERRRQGRTAP